MTLKSLDVNEINNQTFLPLFSNQFPFSAAASSAPQPLHCKYFSQVLQLQFLKQMK